MKMTVGPLDKRILACTDCWVTLAIAKREITRPIGLMVASFPAVPLSPVNYRESEKFYQRR